MRENLPYGHKCLNPSRYRKHDEALQFRKEYFILLLFSEKNEKSYLPFIVIIINIHDYKK